MGAPDAWREPESINALRLSIGPGFGFLWMSIRLIAMDVDPEEGVMLRSDYITYADTSDCLVSFFSHPFTVAHVRYDLADCWWHLMYDTI